LGDFGFAVQLDSIEETFQGSAGSPFYMAPEVLFKNVYSSKSDIWAIGMIYL
jgi:serine/threonine protein kinase